MFGIATRSGRFERRTARRLSTWTRDYLREVALADLGCAVAGVFVAAQIRFGRNVTSPYLALSLALLVLWVAALWLAGAYDVRFIGTGRKRASGKCIHSVVAVGHELAVADLVTAVEPRPALPDGAEKYAEHVRCRPVVKPGLLTAASAARCADDTSRHR